MTTPRGAAVSISRRHARAHQRLEQSLRLANRLVEAQRLERDCSFVLAGKGHQLVDQRGPSSGGRDRPLQGVRALRGIGPDQLRDLDRSQHGLQDVAEVVCHAARERPDRFHLLGVPQLVFERTLTGDVADDTDGAQHPSIVGLHHEAAAVNPARRPIRTVDPIRLADRDPLAQAVPGGGDTAPILGIDRRQPAAFPAGQPGGGTPPDSLEGRTDVRNLAEQLADIKSVLDVLGELAETRLARPQLVFGVAKVADIDDRGLPALALSSRLGGGFEPHGNRVGGRAPEDDVASSRSLRGLRAPVQIEPVGIPAVHERR